MYEVVGRATSRRTRLRRGVLGVVVAASTSLALGAAPALANAPNPIQGTTKVDSVVHNPNGSWTVTVQGGWNWVTQTDCPTARDGVGYQVDWFDSSTANPIGNAKSPDGILYVGGAQDNIVHSVDSLGDAGTGNDTWDGVPGSYLSHNVSDSTPDSTDAANWVSNCNHMNPSTQVSSGTWGPISHTYPAGASSFTLCPIMYDPHGKGTTSGGVIGSSSVKDLTAGGAGHNADNSYEGNGQANACLKSSFPIGGRVKGKKIKRHRHRRHHHHHRISRRPKRTSRGFTG